MNKEERGELYKSLYNINIDLQDASQDLKEAPDRAADAIAAAQTQINHMLDVLSEEISKDLSQEPRGMRLCVSVSPDILALYTSAANKRLLAALEAAHLAAREVDRERDDLSDGISVHLGDLIEIRRSEIYGFKSTNERSHQGPDEE